MKINNKELKILYQEYIAEKGKNREESCPPPKEFQNLFSAAFPMDKKEKILEHIFKCGYCTDRFLFFLQLSRFEEKLTESIKTISKNNQENFIKRKSRQRISFPRLLWKYSSVVLSSLIIFFTISFFLFLLVTNKPDSRNPSLIEPELISPTLLSSQESSIIFQWKKVENADYYILDIFNDSLLPFWKSDRILGASFVLPQKVKLRMSFDKNYFCMISVFFPNGKKLESRLKKFRVSK